MSNLTWNETRKWSIYISVQLNRRLYLLARALSRGTKGSLNKHRPLEIFPTSWHCSRTNMPVQDSRQYMNLRPALQNIRCALFALGCVYTHTSVLLRNQLEKGKKKCINWLVMISHWCAGTFHPVVAHLSSLRRCIRSKCVWWKQL